LCLGFFFVWSGGGGGAFASASFFSFALATLSFFSCTRKTCPFLRVQVLFHKVTHQILLLYNTQNLKSPSGPAFWGTLYKQHCMMSLLSPSAPG
jgi:hypothetical protein